MVCTFKGIVKVYSAYSWLQTMELIIGLFQSGTGNFGALSSADIQQAVETLACHLKQEVVGEGGLFM